MKERSKEALALDKVARSRLLYATLKELGDKLDFHSLSSHNQLSRRSEGECQKTFSFLKKWSQPGKWKKVQGAHISLFEVSAFNNSWPVGGGIDAEPRLSGFKS